MMVSGARKGFWGVPPYERLGGRGVVSVPQMVKGRSLRLIALGVLLCCALALGGCGGGRKGGSLPPAESGSFEGPKGSIADLRRLPQDLLVYARQGNPDKPLMSAAEQARQDARFNSLFFGPWEAVRSSVSASEAFAIFGGQKKRSKARGWAENLLPWTQENWDKLTANAARDAYPSRFDKAITVRPTVLREAPTHKPRFGNPAEAGEGYPFDMFMYSTLPVGMPLLVVHTSADGASSVEESAGMTDADWAKLGNDFMQRMGLMNHQYIIVKHSGTEKNRRQAHLHILANRVSLLGELYKDNWIGKRATEAANSIARERNLVQSKDIGKANREEIKQAMDSVLTRMQGFDLAGFSRELGKLGFKVREARASTGKLNGYYVTSRSGTEYKASEIGKGYTLAHIKKTQKKLKYNSISRNYGNILKPKDGGLHL